MIKAEGIHKTFEDFTALDNITCSISDGCIYGMVGSNGAGKSTFLRVLSGIYKPDKGCAYIDNAPIYENPKVKENIVFVADELFFLPGATINKMAALLFNKSVGYHHADGHSLVPHQPAKSC